MDTGNIIKKTHHNPIPNRTFLLQLVQRQANPLTLEQLCQKLNVTDPLLQEGIRRRLIAMVRDGQIDENRLKRTFFPLVSSLILEGYIQANKEGSGFVLNPDGDDPYLSYEQMKQVFHGDKVRVRLIEHKGGLRGRIINVLERHTHRLVGRYNQKDGRVKVNSPRIFQPVRILPKDRNNAQSGQTVVVDIVSQPEKNRLPYGKITNILGDQGTPGIEIDIALHHHGIPHTWSDGIKNLLESLPSQIDDTDKASRIDLTHLPFMTIDGEEAKDFDDAVYCEQTKNGHRLWVAIADVSHYVLPDLALDKEAQTRATSVYFPGQVVPMLPEVLSNGLCSLNPNKDRLVMVCEVQINEHGKQTEYCFYEGLIHSKARLTYQKAWSMLEQRLSSIGKQNRQQYKNITASLDDLYQLFKQLKKQRHQRGALEFESIETRIMLDDDRKIKRILPVARNDAHKMIEECMLLANVCAADFLQQHNISGLYRVHSPPLADRIVSTHKFLGKLGLSLKGGTTPNPKDYQALFKQANDRPDKQVIHTVLLRSMNQAMYQSDNIGHFGLAYDAYTHFTSPIRRYPDLLVHRAIRSVICSSKPSKWVKRPKKNSRKKESNAYLYDKPSIESLGAHCSMAERRADAAARDAIDALKCTYMLEHVGSTFEGTVSSVTAFGLFVQLTDIYAEGLLHISQLGSDFFIYDSIQHQLIGEHSRQVYQLGDTLRVKVVKVDINDKRIYFEQAASQKQKMKRSIKKNRKK